MSILHVPTQFMMIVVLFFVLIFTTSTFVAAFSRDQCHDIGFNPSVLLCTTCTTVTQLHVLTDTTINF